MKVILFNLGDSSRLFDKIMHDLQAEQGKFTHHVFPDGESYLRVLSNVQDREVIIFSSLDQPNTKILPLLFLTKTLKDLGAKRVGLLAPYLAYMRQDAVFNPGEAITSQYFARLLSTHFDWLVTLDPHLHRYHQLGDIYSIPAKTASATQAIAQWIKQNIKAPVLIGSDEESEQWVASIANFYGFPYVIAAKKRKGDKIVEVTIPNLAAFKSNIPVLVDDIISSAMTLIETLKKLKLLTLRPAVCIGVHAVFGEDAYQRLLTIIPETRIITCNSIEHVTNHIDVTAALIEKIEELF